MQLTESIDDSDATNVEARNDSTTDDIETTIEHTPACDNDSDDFPNEEQFSDVVWLDEDMEASANQEEPAAVVQTGFDGNPVNDTTEENTEDGLPRSDEASYPHLVRVFETVTDQAPMGKESFKAVASTLMTVAATALMDATADPEDVDNDFIRFNDSGYAAVACATERSKKWWLRNDRRTEHWRQKVPRLVRWRIAATLHHSIPARQRDVSHRASDAAILEAKSWLGRVHWTSAAPSTRKTDNAYSLSPMTNLSEAWPHVETASSSLSAKLTSQWKMARCETIVVTDEKIRS